MNTPTIVVWNGDVEPPTVLAVRAPEVMHAVLRDGVFYAWLYEPRPNRFDEEAWIEVVW